MTYMSHHTLPLKHIKELQKSSCTLKLTELLGLTSLNGSFSREGTKQTSLTKSFAFCMLTFLHGRTETEAQNSRVMQLCELLVQFVLGFETKHLCQPILSSHYLAHPSLPLQTPYKTPLSLRGEKRTLLEGHVSFCGTHLSSRVRMRSGVRSRLSAPRHQHIRVMSLFIKSARLRLTKTFHRSMLVQSS